jgi:uncharacterized membrane protein SpoIIM required for sporulation/ABC-type transport system involved in multi-copper enzyme maturation permease subunit
MRRNFSAIWLVARREVVDQVRDWRIVVPMLVLVSIFPFIADSTTRQAIGFMNRFGGELILANLIPFVVLVIGFFPLAFTLVVALESFVGEKERGTIEPLLSSPLEDSQLYPGKLLVGVVTPLLFSYGSIAAYLILLARRDVAFPSPYMLTLIMLLTFAHAVFMVSAAIVISVQATSVRAASLLASFVIVPVAFLLQAETILIFWGNEDILWLAIIAVTLLSLLLVRLGLAHFRREYLLGREIDTLDFKLTWRKFGERFVGNAKSVVDWYRNEIPETVRQLRKPLVIISVLALVAGIASYLWVIKYVPAHINLTPERVTTIRTFVADNLMDLNDLSGRIPVPILFLHNARTTVAFLLLGLLSFSTLGLTLFIGNIGLVGGVMGAASLVGYSPLLTFVAGVLPHGIFELSAVFLGTAAMFKVGAQLVTPQTDKSLGEVLLLSLADWCRIFVGLVIPLLAVAAVIEVYVTPQLIKLAFPYL